MRSGFPRKLCPNVHDWGQVCRFQGKIGRSFSAFTSREVQDALQYFNTTLILLDQAEELPTALFDVILELARVCPLVLMGRDQTLLPQLQHPSVWKNRQGTLRLTPPSVEDILHLLHQSLHLPQSSYVTTIV